jgi:hypothetical protein
MKRLLTLASAGLFATGLAIFPVSVFAQPNAATGVEKKAPIAAQVTGHDMKSIPAGKEALSKDAAKAAPASKDAAKSATAKAGSVKAATAPAHGGTPVGSSTGTPAKVGG